MVCKSCGSEVSPYVTECPYCGARLRKRAPKLELRADGLEAKRRRRARRPRFGRSRLEALDGARPWATIVLIAASCMVVLFQRATDDSPLDLGAIAGPVGSDWWRYLSAPFAYFDIGYLFVVALAVVIFVPGIERRLGSVSAGVLLVACGALGMLAADGIEGDAVAAGGNGVALGAIAAWFALRHAESRRAIDEDYDQIGVAVATVAVLALPLFDDWANAYAGVVAGLVGGLGGMAAARLRPAE